YYNLGDEPGIADLAAFWDFDFSPASLNGMRAWLAEQYGSLARLNAQWGSHFAAWDRVMPMTTREAMVLTDDNYSAWADFKAWMDVAFAQALRAGTDAVHAADPEALAAIEGTQVPGWGGYDYTQLAKAVDLMELYDFGDNVEIVRSLNPKMVMLTTSGAAGPAETRRIWRELLRGGRGLILWDEKDEFVGEDGSLKSRGRAMAPLFRELRGGLADLLIASARHTDPIAFLYSPASFRTQWMLDWRRRGEAWSRRGAADEYEENAIRSASAAYARAIEHMGLQQRTLSPELIEAGALRSEGFRVLILPHAISLAPAEAEEIRRFVAAGGVLVADSEPGLFDQHSRRLAKPLLSEIFTHAPSGSSASFAFGSGKALHLVPDRDGPAERGSAGGRTAFGTRLAAVIAEAGITPVFRLEGSDGKPISDVESYLFHDGRVSILALLRDAPAAEGDKGAGTVGASESEKILLELPHSSFVYDLRTRKQLGATTRLALGLTPYEPAILAISDDALPVPTITAPVRLALGETAELPFALSAPTPAARHVFHVEIIGPGGNLVPAYSGNLPAPGGSASMPLPLALNDAAGKWQVRVTDYPSGQTAEAEISVSAP
ncbi:MAG TPA: alpha-amylase family protein, partial [Alphaproteobacteria bacterium]|nr:alpha-amylase family protein [Alphaproteobacteria bacterium]